MALSVDAQTRSEWIIIGISGVTCGGKTTLARRLCGALRPARVFHQDRYFFPDHSARHVRCAGLPHNNYDILSSLDMESFHSDVVSTLRGHDKSHAADGAPAPGAEPGAALEAPGLRFLILEGFTALNYKPLNDLCDLRYYLVLEYEQCLARRVLRLYDPPDVAGYFEQCVWPEHLKYRAEMERDRRVTLVDGTEPDTFERVLADVRALIAARR